MTIDKAISHLDTYSSTMGSGQTTQAQHEEAKRVAKKTMRKYQKITEIVTKWHNDMSFKTSMAMTEIEEVLENENAD